MYVTLKIFTDRLGVPVSMLPEKYAFDLTGYINGLIGTALNNVDHITFNLAPVTPPTEGTLVWNSNNGTLELGLGGGNTVLQIGQENVIRVINGTSSILNASDYKAVCQISASSERISVQLAKANSSSTKDVIGLVIENIAVGGEGFVCNFGEVTGIDTTGTLQGEIWMDGDVLYLSPTTTGGLTNIKPTSPDYSVVVGYVEYVDAINGKIFVNITNADSLSDLSDVYMPTTPTNNDVLTWVSVNSRAEFLPASGSSQDLCSVLTVGNSACTDINLNQNDLINTGSIDFDITPANTGAVARMQWNDTDGTLDLGLKGGNVTLQLGEEIVARVVNKTGVDLYQSGYKIVKVSGAQGQRLAIDFAQANSGANSDDTLGVVIENIAKNQEGFIAILGQVHDINTTGSLQGETWVDGDALYLSPTVPGGLTKVSPIAPNHRIIIGYVEYAHAIHGKIYVRVDTGSALSDLHDVYIATTPSNGQVLSYDSTNAYWKPVTQSIPVVTPSALTKTDDTNVTLTLTGTPSTALLQAVNLQLGWTGTLADSRIASASTWNAKEPAIAAGTTLQYWRGDKTWQTLPTASIVLHKNSTLSTVTGTTSQTILQSVLIPANTFAAGDLVEVIYRGVKSGTGGIVTYRFNINTSLSIVGMTTLVSQSLAAGGTYAQVERTYNIINTTTNTQAFGISSTLTTDTQNSSTAVSTLAIDWTVNQYMFTTGQLANTGDTFTSNFILIKQNK